MHEHHHPAKYHWPRPENSGLRHLPVKRVPTPGEIHQRRLQEDETGARIPRNNVMKRHIRSAIREVNGIIRENTHRIKEDYSNFSSMIEHLRGAIVEHIDNTVNDAPYLTGVFLPSFDDQVIGIYPGGNAISIEDKNNGLVLQLANNAINGDVDIHIGRVRRAASGKVETQQIDARLRSDNQFTLIENDTAGRQSHPTSYTITSERDLLIHDPVDDLNELYAVASLYIPNLLF